SPPTKSARHAFALRVSAPATRRTRWTTSSTWSSPTWPDVGSAVSIPLFLHRHLRHLPRFHRNLKFLKSVPPTRSGRPRNLRRRPGTTSGTGLHPRNPRCPPPRTCVNNNSPQHV